MTRLGHSEAAPWHAVSTRYSALSLAELHRIGVDWGVSVAESESHQPDAGADPGVPAARRRARRTASARRSFAPPCGVGGPAGQHAACCAPLDPRARRAGAPVDLGAPVARAGLGAALQHVRRSGARSRSLHARQAAGRRARTAARGGRRRALARGPRRPADDRPRGGAGAGCGTPRRPAPC